MLKNLLEKENTMRLKGGKLFLDLSKNFMGDDPEIELTQSQIDTILSKGVIDVSIKVNYSHDVITLERTITDVDSNDGGDIIYRFEPFNDLSNSIEYVIKLNTTKKLFYINAQ